ncbi:MAG: Asp-tRNA(Asn)/Glu-tRNA(Gln) amidotransferase subunit GatA [Oscillospiraceae bacterium]|nr:Asp-tRNA(Asn)/Glu-tRNA(Gln) amidotransferase subunit GatA [Oscillospiraceae bacterium]
MTARELASALSDKTISARELAGEYLARAKELNPSLQAYITICGESAEKQAELADKLLTNGKADFLTGLPVGVKDNICTKGVRTTCASRMLRNYVPMYDATAVKTIKRNGGVILGKCDMDEFAMGAFGENSALSECKNPIDDAFSPGGSSSGVGASVAAGLASWGLGSDTGGSLRIPASFCGCVGFKPTYGAISRYGLISYASSMDTVGIITKTAEDACFIAPQLFGKDACDMTSRSIGCKVDRLCNLKGVTFAFSEEDMADAETEITAVLHKTADMLEKLGAKRISKSSLPSAEADYAYSVISCAEAMSNLARYDGIRFGGDGTLPPEQVRETLFGEVVRERIEYGNFVLREENFDAIYVAAQKVRESTEKEYDALFDVADIVLSPLVDFSVPKRGETDALRADKFTVSANFAGVPAISLPMSKDKNGLPVSVQLMSGKGCDGFLLAASRLLEKEAAR